MTRIDEIIPRMIATPTTPEIIELECGHHVYNTPDRNGCALCRVGADSPWDFVKAENVNKRPIKL